MPRSLREIIDQADEMARAFETYDPRDEDERPAEALVAVQAAARLRAEAERHVVEAVIEARASGLSWAIIGAALGTSGEAARQRYSALAQ